MASSSAVRNKSGGQSKISCWFKAEIHPSKEKIYMCPIFAKKYASNINFKSYGWIKSKNKGCTMVVFKWKNDQCYISDGRVVAKRNGFKVPTTVTLYFEGEDNMFTMLPTTVEGRSSVLKTPPHHISYNDWSFNHAKSFQTVISPHEERIDICPDFLNNFKNIINFKRPVSIRNGKKVEAEVLLKCRRGVWYLSGGLKIAKTFGLKKPTNVVLEFQFKDNKFLMIEKKVGKKTNNVEADKTPMIILSSDFEDEADKDHAELLRVGDSLVYNTLNADDHDEDPLRYYHFDIKITESMASTKQVMHFPNKTSKHVLPANQKKIYIRDINTGRVIQCKIKTSTRCVNEKYLGKGWYQFKNELMLNAGDVLKCSIEDPPQYINVMIIRAASLGLQRTC